MLAVQFAHERMAVLETCGTLRRLADMRNDIARLERIAFEEISHRRLARRFLVDEEPARDILIEGYTSCIHVMIGDSAAARKPGERKRYVGRLRATEGKKLAHRSGRLPPCFKDMRILTALQSRRRRKFFQIFRDLSLQIVVFSLCVPLRSAGSKTGDNALQAPLTPLCPECVCVMRKEAGTAWRRNPAARYGVSNPTFDARHISVCNGVCARITR
jgi:hypothetical protein